MTTWIEKQRNLVDFTLSSLLRHKGKNLSLVAVYTIVVFVLASMMFFSHALKIKAGLILKDMPEMVVQKMIAGRHELIPTSYAPRLSAIQGVVSVKPRLWGYYFFPLMKANYTVMAPDVFRHPEGTTVIGPGVARAHDLRKGNIMGFNAVDGSPVQFTVGGILPVGSELVSADLVLVTRADFRRLFGMPDGYATDLVLSVRNQRELPVIAAKIAEMLPDTRPIMRDEMLRTYEAVLDWRHGLLISVFFGALLAFGILAWDKASGLSAEERKEIGILKAVGWETSEVIVMKSWEGIVISLSAFLLGLIVAYVHVFFASYIFFEPVLKGWSVLYPQFSLDPYIDPYQIAALFLLTVAPYTAATIIPSWKAAIIDPDAVMRL